MCVTCVLELAVDVTIDAEAAGELRDDLAAAAGRVWGSASVMCV